MASPTSRSLAHLRSQGWTAEVVERWNPHTRTRHDLFGIADIIAFMPESVDVGATILLCQTTAGSSMASRRKKIETSPLIDSIRGAGFYIVLHGWRKAANGRWVLREEDLTLPPDAR